MSIRKNSIRGRVDFAEGNELQLSYPAVGGGGLASLAELGE
jgi:hypothetical protein